MSLNPHSYNLGFCNLFHLQISKLRQIIGGGGFSPPAPPASDGPGFNSATNMKSIQNLSLRFPSCAIILAAESLRMTSYLPQEGKPWPLSSSYYQVQVCCCPCFSLLICLVRWYIHKQHLYAMQKKFNKATSPIILFISE